MFFKKINCSWSSIWCKNFVPKKVPSDAKDVTGSANLRTWIQSVHSMECSPSDPIPLWNSEAQDRKTNIRVTVRGWFHRTFHSIYKVRRKNNDSDEATYKLLSMLCWTVNFFDLHLLKWEVTNRLIDSVAVGEKLNKKLVFLLEKWSVS